jgi:broad specificity phosphatase PhoE
MPLIESLRPETLDAVYSSDLRRALATSAAIANAFYLGRHVSPAWREINFGKWEGLSWNEIEHCDAVYSRQWINMFPDLPAPNGEDIGDFEERILKEVGLLAAKSYGKNIAIVTHAGVQQVILCRLQGYSKKEAWEQTRTYGSIVRYAIPVFRSMQSEEVTP